MNVSQLMKYAYIVLLNKQYEKGVQKKKKMLLESD